MMSGKSADYWKERRLIYETDYYSFTRFNNYFVFCSAPDILSAEEADICDIPGLQAIHFRRILHQS